MPVWIVIVLADLLPRSSVGALFRAGGRRVCRIRTLTREQWQQRVEKTRRRSEEFVANARTRTGLRPREIRRKRKPQTAAMRDPRLQQGDVIATGKGFVVFIGRDEQHKPNDLVSTPDSDIHGNFLPARRRCSGICP